MEPMGAVNVDDDDMTFPELIDVFLRTDATFQISYT
jgi:hypothetical protein